MPAKKLAGKSVSEMTYCLLYASMCRMRRKLYWLTVNVYTVSMTCVYVLPCRYSRQVWQQSRATSGLAHCASPCTYERHHDSWSPIQPVKQTGARSVRYMTMPRALKSRWNWYNACTYCNIYAYGSVIRYRLQHDYWLVLIMRHML